ncbi:MAG TPA: beta-ketoacyl-ACP synthase II [Candidatus Binatia bacterium]|nr:beta-ketoacyl-ACP synthase II [Candidatus Binatia bacterium]
MTGRRVVVTGLGMVTPLGVGVPANWEAACAGRSGIAAISRFDASALPCRIAGEVRGFRPEDWVEPREVGRMEDFILYAIAAATEAVRDAGLEVTEETAERTGVVIGVGIGGLGGIERNHDALAAGGPRRVSPFFIPAVISNLAPAQIAMRIGARGVNMATTTACASGAHAIGEAFEMIRSGRQDVVVAGGAEAAITPTAIAGFGVMRALARWDGPAEEASRPFDARRCGFVLGEGAGVVVLEAESLARARGARIHGEVLGYGASADAYHITQPLPDGEGARRAMERALAEAGVPADAVGHVNAHGTSTKQGDVAETRALHAVFGAHATRLAVSATKSMTGHLLGAAGAVEAIYTVLALRDGVVPPTINLEEPDAECDLDYVPREARDVKARYALSNSFGFGGTNASLLFGRAA